MLKNKALRNALAEDIKRDRAYFKQRVKDARASVLPLEPIAELLDAADIKYCASASALFIVIPYEQERNKATFTKYVEATAKALDVPPDIKLDEHGYRATFCEGKVWCSVYSPEDCQLIDVTETVTRTIKKPHPMCVAALSKLEDIA